MTTLEGNRVVVIGGGSGIGFAVAELARGLYFMSDGYATGQVLPVDGGGPVV